MPLSTDEIYALFGILVYQKRVYATLNFAAFVSVITLKYENL